MKQALKYSLKVWATSAIIGAILLLIYLLIDTKALDKDALGFFAAATTYGAATSIPLLILLALFLWVINKTTLNVVTRKIIVSFLSIIGIWCLCSLLFPFARHYITTIVYAIPTLGGIWFYKLESADKASVNAAQL
ncbi:MAG: hypothetical protein JSU01_11630 [Bacteroidetes bacterium]|nr:hypothetical protein [Bacteroidota bacterium]